jgi:hypothetical protein
MKLQIEVKRAEKFTNRQKDPEKQNSAKTL